MGLSVVASSVPTMTSPPRSTKTPQFRCTECGWTSVKWVGRCGECQTWGTVSELGAPPAGQTHPHEHGDGDEEE